MVLVEDCVVRCLKEHKLVTTTTLDGFCKEEYHHYTISRRAYRFHIRSISFSSYCSLISFTRKTRYRPSLSSATMYNFSPFFNKKHLSALSSKKQSPPSRTEEPLSSFMGLKAEAVPQNKTMTSIIAFHMAFSYRCKRIEVDNVGGSPYEPL